MKKIILILSLLSLIAVIVIGCSSDVTIRCTNKSSLFVYVSGDSNGYIKPGDEKAYTIKTGGCLDFAGVTAENSTATVKDWGYHCFETDNGFTFRDF